MKNDEVFGKIMRFTRFKKEEQEPIISERKDKFCCGYELERCEGYHPYSIPYLICPTCDSTYFIDEFCKECKNQLISCVCL